MTDVWNPWHGCRKYSAGCAHCYVYRRDETIGRDASRPQKTASFALPLRRGRDGAYKVAPGSTLYTCLTSDFFLEEADVWRGEAWAIMRARPDVRFVIITKRITRAADCLPDDWGDGYPNVVISATMENDEACALRFPALLALPAREKSVVCEPLLGPIDMRRYLDGRIASVSVGGESGPGARVCRYAWVLDIRAQCVAAGVPFCFRQTGANFERDGRIYRIPRRLQLAQARRANIDTQK